MSDQGEPPPDEKPALIHNSYAIHVTHAGPTEVNEGSSFGGSNISHNATSGRSFGTFGHIGSPHGAIEEAPQQQEERLLVKLFESDDPSGTHHLQQPPPLSSMPHIPSDMPGSTVPMAPSTADRSSRSSFGHITRPDDSLFARLRLVDPWSQYLTTPSNTASQAHSTHDFDTRSKSQSRSHSNLSSVSTDQGSTRSFRIVPREEYMRRDAAWFTRGRVFHISDDCQKDWIISERTMMVLHGSGTSAITCLPLCRHPEIDGSEQRFLRPRIRVYAAGASSVTSSSSSASPSVSTSTSAPPMLPTSRWPAIPIQVHVNRMLLPDVWINCAKPYTIHHQYIEVAYLGGIGKKALQTLQEAYLTTQGEMISRAD